MADIAEVPMPEILDPDRLHSHDRDDMTLIEHRTRAQQLDDALHSSCDYAQGLWRELQAVRQYLMDNLPSDPTTGEVTRVSASPTGFDDNEGWQNWIEVYASVTSALAGPHGDMGFGRDEARLAAQNRQSRAALLPDEELAHLPSQRDEDGKRLAESFIRARAERLGGPATHRTNEDNPSGSSGSGSSGSGGPAGLAGNRSERLRLAAEAVMFVLALRGVRGRRGRRASA